MLTKQAVRLEQALIDGGVNPLAANSAMSAVGNCSQALIHRGPVSVDSTPPDFKFVTPELRKFRFPNLEQVSGEMPRIRPPQEEKEEEDDRLPPEPQKENLPLREPFQPTNTNNFNAKLRISAGPFIRVDGPSASPRVSLNGSGGNGEVAAFEGNSLRGRRLTVKSSNEKVLKVERNGLEFTIQPKGETIEVITGIAIEGERLTLRKRPMFGFAVGAEVDDSIPFEQMEYVYDVEDGGGGIYFKRESRYVLGSPGESIGQIDIPVTDCTV
jgi:hypothetical protein